MDNTILIIASWLALIIRVLAIAIMAVVVRIQARQFKIKSSVQRLKWLLLTMVGLLIISNLPIIYLHIARINNWNPDPTITALATLTNSASTLLVAIMLYLIYRFR